MLDVMPCAGLSLSKGRRRDIHLATMVCLSCSLDRSRRTPHPEAAAARYSKVFSSAELRFLTRHADSYGWYVSTRETRELIEALCARGLMAANGDFKVIATNVGSRTDREQRKEGSRYYELIGEGCLAFYGLHSTPCDLGRK